MLGTWCLLCFVVNLIVMELPNHFIYIYDEWMLKIILIVSLHFYSFLLSVKMYGLMSL